MLFTTTLLLAFMPAALLAAPTANSHLSKRRTLSAAERNMLLNGDCDLTFATMPAAPQVLPQPSAGLKLAHVAVGRGTQNYTCADSTDATAPKAIGAMATLYNMTCLSVRAPSVLADMVNIAAMDPPPANDIAGLLESGHHEFTETGVPLFKLITDKTNFGYVKAKPVANSTAPANANKGPEGNGSVLWLKLAAVEGDYKEVYRLVTSGGAAPKTCKNQPATFQVRYATQYWFWK